MIWQVGWSLIGVHQHAHGIHIIPNDTNGADLSEEDKVDVESIAAKLEEDQEREAVLTGNNTRAKKKYTFDQVIDRVLLRFVHTKLDLFKKLSDPNINQMIKSRLFEHIQHQVQ